MKTENRMQSRRDDDRRLEDLTKNFAIFVAESREFRSKYGTMLEESLAERTWWKATISEAKRKGVVTVLCVSVMTALAGFLLGVKTYWNKIFPYF